MALGAERAGVLQLVMREWMTTLLPPVRPSLLNDTPGLPRIAMTVYEMRTYTLHVGKMAEAVQLYTEFGYPALQKEIGRAHV